MTEVERRDIAERLAGLEATVAARDEHSTDRHRQLLQRLDAIDRLLGLINDHAARLAVLEQKVAAQQATGDVVHQVELGEARRQGQDEQREDGEARRLARFAAWIGGGGFVLAAGQWVMGIL